MIGTRLGMASPPPAGHHFCTDRAVPGALAPHPSPLPPSIWPPAWRTIWCIIFNEWVPTPIQSISRNLRVCPLLQDPEPIGLDTYG